MIKIIYTVLLFSSFSYGVTITNCSSNEVYNPNSGVCVPTTCTDSTNFNYLSYTCECKTKVNGVCATRLSTSTCSEYIEVKENALSCPYGFIHSSNNLVTIGGSCYSSDTSFSVGCNVPLYVDTVDTINDGDYSAPDTSTLDADSALLVDEFALGNEALLNQNKTLLENKELLQEISANEKNNLIANNETNNKLDKLNGSIKANNNKDELNTLIALDSYRLNKSLEDEDNGIRIANDYNNSITKNNDLLTTSINSFSADYSTKLDSITTSYLDVLGFGSYGSRPSPKTFTMYGIEYKIFDLAVIDSSNLSLIRNSLLYGAYLVGLMIVFRG